MLVAHELQVVDKTERRGKTWHSGNNWIILTLGHRVTWGR
jgi:hypothetical protein